jgi:hypothetical protein
MDALWLPTKLVHWGKQEVYQHDVKPTYMGEPRRIPIWQCFFTTLEAKFLWLAETMVLFA